MVIIDTRKSFLDLILFLNKNTKIVIIAEMSGPLDPEFIKQRKKNKPKKALV